MIYTVNISEQTFINACKYGNNNILLLLYKKNINKILDEYIICEGAKHACNGGHLQVLKLIFQFSEINNTNINLTEIFCCACCSGNLEIAKFILHH